MIDVHLDAADFVAWMRRAEVDLLAGVRQALGQNVALALRLARTTTAFKDRTGALRRSISRAQTGTWRHTLRASAPHAVFVEKGTRPRVFHPGTKPTHFMQRAADAAEVSLVHDVNAALARALR